MLHKFLEFFLQVWVCKVRVNLKKITKKKNKTLIINDRILKKKIRFGILIGIVHHIFYLILNNFYF